MKAHTKSAFTLTELLAVVVLLIVLTLLGLPALARGRSVGGTAQCLNNLRQLAAGWSMYAADNRGFITHSYPGTNCSYPFSWCQGNGGGTGAAGSYCYGAAQTNGIVNGKLWNYVKSLDVYRCPLDHRVATTGAQLGKPFLRSYSMNCWMAGVAIFEYFDITTPDKLDFNPHRLFVKQSQMPHPSSLWVIMEEDEASIGDGMMLVDMTANSYKFYDLPSRRHGGFYPLNFADGHAETIKFVSKSIVSWTPGSFSTAYASDWSNLAARTTVVR